MVSNILIKFNRYLMIACSYWAAMNGEFNVATSGWIVLVDRLTMLWSFVILITCSIKFSRNPSARQYQQTLTLASNLSGAGQHLSAIGGGESWQWSELLLLDYLPHINQFSVLYYGMAILTVGLSLIWRIYLAFFRDHAVKRNTGSSRLAFDGSQFDAKREVFDFFIKGPTRGRPVKRLDTDADTPEEKRRPPIVSDDTIRCPFETPAVALHLERPASRTVGAKGDLLLRAHEKHQSRWAGMRRRHLGHGRPSGPPLVNSGSNLGWHTNSELGGRVEMYRIPIRGADYLYDKSEQRWLNLAWQVYTFNSVIVFCACPLTYWTVIGLNQANERFGHSPSDIADNFHGGPVSTDLISRGQLIACLKLYGFIEQMYGCSQMAMFFSFTNIFITLFHADIIYKVKPIQAELKRLTELYQNKIIDTLPADQLYRQQLRIWTYFDQINLYDNFLSRYSVASLIALVTGLSFGQSYLQIDDFLLKVGTLAALFCNTLSFSYLHLISEHIERESYSIRASILVILACERRPELRREWQRILGAFFQSDWKRTFTFIGKYPTNLRTFSKVATAMSAICTLIHRLFHRNQWNVSFAT